MAVSSKSLLVAGLISTAVAWSPARVGPTSRAKQSPADSVERARALHVLNRLAFGPGLGDVDRVVAMGVDRYIEQQLNPEKIKDDQLERRLASFEVLRTSPETQARI